MALTLGIDLDYGQVRLCLVRVDGPHQIPFVEWLTFAVPFKMNPGQYCEFGHPLFDTIANFLFIKNVTPQQIHKIYFVCGYPYSAFPSFEEGLHYTANVFIQSLFDPERVGFLRADGKPFTPREVLAVKGEQASAFVATQFYGSAYIASHLFKNGILVDIGARDTHVTPILKGIIDPQGRSRPFIYLKYRLTHHRLLPNGALHTPLSQISQGVVLKNKIHYFTSYICRMTVVCTLLKLLSGEISQEHDFPLPPDNIAQLFLRRALGLDHYLISDRELQEVAQVVFETQCGQIAQAVMDVRTQQSKRFQKSLNLISTGLAGQVYMDEAIKQSDFTGPVLHLSERLPHRLHEASAAYGAALYAMERLMDAAFLPDKVKAMP